MDLIKQSEGRVVAVSSVAGRYTQTFQSGPDAICRTSVPCGAPYAVAKYGVEAYMDAIR